MFHFTSCTGDDRVHPPSVAADGGCERDVLHRMNEGYRAWGALKSVPSNRGLGIKAKKCLYEGVIIVPTALYGAEYMKRGAQIFN